MAAYTTIDDPTAHFQVELYTGTGSSNARTFDSDTDMQPDMVWIKSRSDTEYHRVYDVLRGVHKEIYVNGSNEEATNSNALTAFGSDGFTVGSETGVNANTETHVAWCWKANGSGSSNTSGTINTTATSANTTAGFSIITYTGNATAGATIGHGIGIVPELFITKRLTPAESWTVYHAANGNNKYLILDTTAAAGTGTTLWNDTDPTTTLFSLGSGGNTNSNTHTFVAYCWAPVQGFSSFKSYVGNGNADGPFVYTGFRPAFVLVKNASAVADPYQFDNKRDPANDGAANVFSAADQAAEWTGEYCDLLSNGFKIRNTTAAINGDGNTIVYWAWAEAPLVNSEGVPCNAR